MADKDDKPLENKDAPASTSKKDDTSGNEDWKAKYEQEVKDHAVTTQQRNMYRNQAKEAEDKASDLSKKHDELQGEFDRLRGEKETSEKAQAIDTKRSEILKNYSEDIQKRAKELGIDLADPEDKEAIDAFTKKLDILKGEDKTETTEGDKPKVPITSDNKPKTEPSAAKTEEESLAEEEARLEGVKF